MAPPLLAGPRIVGPPLAGGPIGLYCGQARSALAKQQTGAPLGARATPVYAAGNARVSRTGPYSLTSTRPLLLDLDPAAHLVRMQRAEVEVRAGFAEDRREGLSRMEQRRAERAVVRVHRVIELVDLAVDPGHRRPRLHRKRGGE